MEAAWHLSASSSIGDSRCFSTFPNITRKSQSTWVGQTSTRATQHCPKDMCVTSFTTQSSTTIVSQQNSSPNIKWVSSSHFSMSLIVGCWLTHSSRGSSLERRSSPKTGSWRRMWRAGSSWSRTSRSCIERSWWFHSQIKAANHFGNVNIISSTRSQTNEMSSISIRQSNPLKSERKESTCPGCRSMLPCGLQCFRRWRRCKRSKPRFWQQRRRVRRRQPLRKFLDQLNLRNSLTTSTHNSQY